MSLTQDKTGTVWKITGTTTTATVIWAGPVWIDMIRWQGVDAAGDDLLVVTGSGDTIVADKAYAGDATNDVNYEYTNLGSPVMGVTVTTLDSGTLFIHTK